MDDPTIVTDPSSCPNDYNSECTLLRAQLNDVLANVNEVLLPTVNKFELSYTRVLKELNASKSTARDLENLCSSLRAEIAELKSKKCEECCEQKKLVAKYKKKYDSIDRLWTGLRCQLLNKENINTEPNACDLGSVSQVRMCAIAAEIEDRNSQSPEKNGNRVTPENRVAPVKSDGSNCGNKQIHKTPERCNSNIYTTSPIMEPLSRRKLKPNNINNSSPTSKCSSQENVLLSSPDIVKSPGGSPLQTISINNAIKFAENKNHTNRNVPPKILHLKTDKIAKVRYKDSRPPGLSLQHSQSESIGSEGESKMLGLKRGRNLSSGRLKQTTLTVLPAPVQPKDISTVDGFNGGSLAMCNSPKSKQSKTSPVTTGGLDDTFFLLPCEGAKKNDKYGFSGPACGNRRDVVKNLDNIFAQAASGPKNEQVSARQLFPFNKDSKCEIGFDTLGDNTFFNPPACSTQIANTISKSEDHDDVTAKTVAKENEKPPPLQSSYDILPKVQDSPDFKYRRDAVRKKVERQNLPGQDCDHCANFYKDQSQVGKMLNLCSRHRDKYPIRQNTPPNFWNANFTFTDD